MKLSSQSLLIDLQPLQFRLRCSDSGVNNLLHSGDILPKILHCKLIVPPSVTVQIQHEYSVSGPAAPPFLLLGVEPSLPGELPAHVGIQQVPPSQTLDLCKAPAAQPAALAQFEPW